MNLHDLNLSIAAQLRAINGDAGPFVAGLLSDDISREDQLTFALRLVQLAEHIKERAQSTAVMVVEGGVSDHDDGGRPTLLLGAGERADHPRPAADD